MYIGPLIRMEGYDVATVMISLVIASLVILVYKLLMSIKFYKEEVKIFNMISDRLIDKLNDLEVHSDPDFQNKMGDLYL